MYQNGIILVLNHLHSGLQATKSEPHLKKNFNLNY
jgi:hypothetical protein